MTIVRHYEVHSCSVDPVRETVTLSDGREVEATVTGLTVELTPRDKGASQTERFIPEDMQAARAMFAVGNRIKVSYDLDVQAPLAEAGA